MESTELQQRFISYIANKKITYRNEGFYLQMVSLLFATHCSQEFIRTKIKTVVASAAIRLYCEHFLFTLQTNFLQICCVAQLEFLAAFGATNETEIKLLLSIHLEGNDEDENVK